MRRLIGLLLLFSLGGCETAKVPAAVGGSRADGTVKLSFEYSILERPQVDWTQADANAAARCSVWGYTGAEKFDAGTRTCVGMTRDGCMRWQIEVTYQCTGKPG